jgi:ATP-binding cassette, subfamily B, bacterial HlyB/CyaB
MHLIITLGWQYAVVFAMYVIAYLIYEYHMNVKQAKLVKVKNAYFEKVSGNMHEVTANIATVKSLGMADTLHAKAKQFEEQYNELSRKAQFTGTKKWWGIQFISAFFLTVMIYIGAMDIVHGAITLGVLVVVATYIGKTQGALNSLSEQADNVVDAKYAIYRIRPLLQEQTKQDGTASIPKNWKRIQFQNVSFKYKEKYVLRNVSFAIKRGEKIGIVGASGQGKSTILKLILRLYTPTVGEILIDNIPLSSISQRSISQNISIVPQDVELFNVSIRDNIAILENKSPFAIQRSLQVALCQPIIEKLPQGIDSIVGEKGVRLSGGEKQRIAIARAVYAKPEVLLLDESTSHLDSKTEYQIQHNIENELNQKTVITVAHRFSTLRNVDRIFVLDEGTIAEEGSYSELLSKKGTFYKLHNLQKNKD